MTEDYYALLGVDPEASEEAILRAYREQAARHHPDVSDDPDAERRFRRLNRAKAVLTDGERRRAYDRLGHDRFVARERGEDASREPSTDRDARRRRPAETGWASPAASTPRRVEPVGPRAGVGGPTGPMAGADVDLRSWFRRPGSDGRTATDDGGSQRQPCPKCRGRGSFVHRIDTARGRRRRVEPCERCGGTGTIGG